MEEVDDLQLVTLLEIGCSLELTDVRPFGYATGERTVNDSAAIDKQSVFARREDCCDSRILRQGDGTRVAPAIVVRPAIEHPSAGSNTG